MCRIELYLFFYMLDVNVYRKHVEKKKKIPNMLSVPFSTQLTFHPTLMYAKIIYQHVVLFSFSDFACIFPLSLSLFFRFFDVSMLRFITIFFTPTFAHSYFQHVYVNS